MIKLIFLLSISLSFSCSFWSFNGWILGMHCLWSPNTIITFNHLLLNCSRSCIIIDRILSSKWVWLSSTSSSLMNIVQDVYFFWNQIMKSSPGNRCLRAPSSSIHSQFDILMLYVSNPTLPPFKTANKEGISNILLSIKQARINFFFLFHGRNDLI